MSHSVQVSDQGSEGSLYKLLR